MIRQHRARLEARVTRLRGANGDIDGMYTASTLDRFKADLEDAARFKRLILPG